MTNLLSQRPLAYGSVVSSGILAALLVTAPGVALELRQIPDEYETTAGIGPALSNGGAANAEPQAAVRTNPALLSLEKTYTVSGGYHWPSAGRDFYQVGVVDSKTSGIAAGLSYTGYTDPYLYSDDSKAEVEEATVDSPIIRRGVVAFGQAFKNIALGVGATYVEANPVYSSEAYARGESRVKGVGLNLGMAGAVTSQLRYGVAAENLTNKKVRDYTPKTYRAGLTYAVSPAIIANLDFRQRDRVVEFEAENVDPLALDGEDDKLMKNPEQLVIGSFSAQLQQYFRVLGSYGQSLTDERRTFGAGASISGDHFTLSYITARPYMRRSASHQAVTLGVQMTM